MEKKINWKKVNSEIKDYVIITLAACIFAFAWAGFMGPNGMSAGGLMGLCYVIQYYTDGVILASYSFLAINSLLILVAILLFGIGFGFKTIYAILFSGVILDVFEGLDWSFLALPRHELLMVPVLAGLFEAVGIGLMIRHGGSSGGTDIIALIVNKYWPVSLSKVFFVTDLLIITSILLVPGKVFADMIYGYVMMISFAVVIDYVVVGDRGTVQVMIFSQKYKEIADHIAEKMERGVTVLKAQGWFTKQDRDVLLVLLRRNELSGLTQVIKETDNQAFMSVNQVGSVYGEGFEEIKAGIRKKKKNVDA